MKKYISSAREYNSNRALEYQSKQLSKQAAKQLAPQRVAYVDSIEDDLKSMLRSGIESEIFKPVLTPDVIDKWLDYHESTYSKYYDPEEYASTDHLAHSEQIWVLAKPEYIEITIDVFGRGDDRGLEWLADLETGGDGGICCWYLSQLPARMKRKFEEYKDIIADLMERNGFEVLEAPKNNRYGFVFKVTNDDYDALTV